MQFWVGLGGLAGASGPAVRLRIEWGGGSEERWQGKISAASGEVSSPAPLGVEADEPGSMWIDHGQLYVLSPSSRVYDGVDVTVEASPQASLAIELSPVRAAGAGPAPPPVKVAIALHELAEAHREQALDSSGNRLLVRRAPGDKLQIVLGRDSLVFQPGEEFELGVRPCLPMVPAGTKLRLQSKLVSARGGRVYWSEERELTAPESGVFDDIPCSLKLPEAEGVYDLVLTCSRRNWSERLGLRAAAEERRVQLVVVSPARPPSAAQEAALEVLVEIDPASPGWWNRLGGLPAQIPLMPNWRKGPLGNGDLTPWQHALGPLVQLGPGAAEPQISWEAYPLPVNKPLQPHILEVEYPSDVPQTLGISIVEPNAVGVVLPIGLDSGVYVPVDAADGKPRMQKHRLAFWPRTTSPLVLVTNRRPGGRAVYGKIRLLGPKTSYLSGLAPLGREASHPYHLPRALAATDPPPSRLLAAYYDRPLFPENFSAGQAVDASSSATGRTLDDWHTFYDGATRLIEYLNHVGYGGLMLSVVADGSSLYPSPLLAPTPRYDDGVFFATGQDPQRKDVLELLLRLFDREGLTLIPAVQFAAPLPELEAVKRRGGRESLGVELVGIDGRTFAAVHGARQGLAAWYNPLHARVQQAMLAAVEELVERCEGHASFGGVALQLSADGYAQFPGAEWGLDEDTLERFAAEAKVDLGPRGADQRLRRAQAAVGAHREKWLAWRARALARFYAQLADAVAEVHPQGKLYLAGADVLNRPELLGQLRPKLPPGATIEEALAAAGLAPELYRSLSRIVWLRPQRLAPLDNLAAQAVNLELNRSSELDRVSENSPSPSGMLYHEPLEARLESFDAKSPFKRTYTRLVAQLSPSGAYNRRRFVHALASYDAHALFDGGWLLPLGQEDEMRDFLAAYRQLPAARFKTVAGATQPVVIRHLAAEGRTYLYLVNDSPWKATVTLSVSAPPGCRFAEFGTDRRLPPLASDGSAQPWTLDLAPFDLLAGTFSSAEVTLGQAKVRLPAQAAETLDQRIRELWSRAAMLKSPPVMPALANGGFEQAAPGGASLPGWHTRGEAASFAVQTSGPHGGQAALRWTATQGGAELISQPFAAPATGRLALSLWLRAADERTQPALRLGVESAGPQPPASVAAYGRYARVGAPPAAQALRAAWSQYVLQLEDLPPGAAQRLQVRLELEGPGEVWVDDVELSDLDFNDSERLELSKLLSLIEYKHKNGEWADCLRLLEGYWPRFLVAHVPLPQEPLARRPAPPPAPAAEPHKPGMLERLRRVLPDWWR